MTETQVPKDFKSGFVALLGRPNVGKSTLLNRILGEKVVIMSDKPQTTRNKIQGVFNSATAQIIFVDTPGIHKPKNKLDSFMDEAAISAIGEVDTIMFMVNATEKLGPGDRYIIEKLKLLNKPVYLIINKIDKIHPNDLLPLVEQYKDLYDWKEVFPISAINGNNTQALLDNIIKSLPNGPAYYPRDQIINKSERFLAQELIREKILQLTHEELPYSVAVIIDKMKEGQPTKIDASIIVERPGQKGIVIGKQGSMLKKIGTLARKDIENLLGTKVYLKLWIKVRPKWRNSQTSLKEFGYKKGRE